jgi:tricarballylate dehydrogenase
MNADYQTAAKLGIEIAYESQVVELNIRGDEFLSARLNNGSLEIVAKALVVASGGFEANIPWLREYWGEAADNFIIRGTRHNQGQLLKQLLEHGGKPVGDPRGCHAVALDARAPKFDGGIVTRLDSVPLGIVVNKQIKRFYDEGEDFWPSATRSGGLIARQPDQIAYSIVDTKALPHFMPSSFHRWRGDPSAS